MRVLGTVTGAVLVAAGLGLLLWGTFQLWEAIEEYGATPRPAGIAAFFGGFLLAGAGLHTVFVVRGVVERAPVTSRDDVP